jgi:hypothetical protein
MRIESPRLTMLFIIQWNAVGVAFAIGFVRVRDKCEIVASRLKRFEDVLWGESFTA